MMRGWERRLAIPLLTFGLACSGPRSELVAREAAEVPVAGAPRGRVSVVDGQLLTDLGTPLRGLLLPVDVGYTLNDFELMESIAETSGLNAVHVYLENWSQPTGVMRAEADALVSLTALAGLYLVIGIGGGPSGDGHPGNGWFDPEKVQSFWSYYGARYANSSHVLFEIQNNPEISCAEPLGEATLELQRSAYLQIRASAPETHVVMFSTSTLPPLANVQRALEEVSDVVDFGNVSFAFHYDSPCAPLEELEAISQLARAQQVPLLFSQLPDENWQPWVEASERLGIGWLHHYWLSGADAELASLRSAVREAGLTWCPERGTFPQDARECR